jgi:hypothetical protein
MLSQFGVMNTPADLVNIKIMFIIVYYLEGEFNAPRKHGCKTRSFSTEFTRGEGFIRALPYIPTVLKETDVRVWTGLMWLRIGSGGGLL